MENFNENIIKQKMDKAIIAFQNDLNGIRAGRASINMLIQLELRHMEIKFHLTKLET